MRARDQFKYFFPLVFWILFGALILNPVIFKFHLKILTESLSLFIFCGVLATIARFCLTKNSSNLGWAMILTSLGAREGISKNLTPCGYLCV